MTTTATHTAGPSANGHKPKGPHDPIEVERALKVLTEPGAVFEVRAIEATLKGGRWPGTVYGYFNDPHEAAVAVQNIVTATAVYVTLNPVNPDIHARAFNRLKVCGKKDSTTADTEIVKRLRLLIDVDANRPANISASNDEHDLAIKRCRAIFAELRRRGWPDPIVGDSGNGGHLIYAIDLPADDGGLIVKVLHTLDWLFPDDFCHVDKTVFNQARITKLFGTLVCKGDSTPDRPHRQARLLSVPDEMVAVTHEQLMALVAEAPEDVLPGHKGNSSKASTSNKSAAAEPFDVAEFIKRNGLEVTEAKDWQGGTRWEFIKSPLCDHHDGAPYIATMASGAVVAKCHHAHCSWGWSDLRAKFKHTEPVREKATRQHDESEAPWEADDAGHAAPDVRQAATKGKAAELPQAWEPFPVEALPDPIRSFVFEVSQSIVCDPAFPALACIVTAGAAIGNARCVAIKDDWHEPSVFWGALVGESGASKSPVITKCVGPLERRQIAERESYTEAYRQYERDVIQYEVDLSDWKRHGSKKCIAQPEKPIEPVAVRYLVGDVTMEGLANRLNENPRGLLMSVDELAAWAKSFDQYRGGRGGDMPKWLNIHGARNIMVDRAGKKTIYVPRAAVSVLGGIQPATLRRVMTPENFDAGLAARLLMVDPPRKAKRWNERSVPSRVQAEMESMFGGLLLLDVPEDGPAPLGLSAEAKALFIDFYNQHAQEQTELRGAEAAAWSKLEGGTARFALMIQLVKAVAGYGAFNTIDESSMQSAITLARWFARETLRLYAKLAEGDESAERRELVELVRRQGGRMTVRDLMRAARRFSKSAGDAEEALNVLVKAGWGRWEVGGSGPDGGRPAAVFILNENPPEVWGGGNE